MFNARITLVALFVTSYAYLSAQTPFCSVGFDQLSPNTLEYFVPGSRFADADNDGDLDFFAFRPKLVDNTSTTPPEIRLFQNNGTSFSLFTTLTTDRFDLADINGDGRLDIVSIDPDIGNSIRLYLNTGTSFTFTPVYTAPTNVTFAGSPEFVDYDNDGDLDISCGVFRRSNGAVFILENDGFLGFTQQEMFAISGSGRNTVTDVKWRDIDNDGDQDCWALFEGADAAGNFRTFPDIYMNQGDGTFNSASARPPSADRSLLEDFDNNGTVDMIVWGDGFQSDNPGASFRYYRGGSSGTNGFVGSISTGDNENIFDIVTFDFDNNGFLDLMVYTSNSQTFARRYTIYRNNGSTFTPDIFGPSTTFSAPYFADFNKDNTADYANATFVIGASIAINFFRGNPPQSTCTSNSRPNTPTSLSAQVDGNSVSLSWLSSDADQNTASLTYEIFLRNQTTGQILHAPSSDQTTGLRKVAAPGRHGSSGSWTFNNLPDGQYAWQVQAIDHFYSGSPWAAGDFQIGTAPCPAYTLDRITDPGFSKYSKFADFDNDGDKDLIIIQDNGDNPPQLHILQNKEGTLPLLDPWNENQILAEHFDLGDADNDGDIDIVFVDNTAIYLLVNNNGAFERKEIFNSIEGWTTSRPAFLDYDNDGDLDVVHYNSVFFTQFNGLAFYENRGDLDFGPGTDYQFSENTVADLRVGDFDNDGDTDVITEERNPFIPDLPHQINIYLNEEGTFTLGPNVGSTGQGLGGFDIGDIDNDGDLDVVGSGLFQFGASTRFYLNDNLNFVEVPVLDQGFGHLRLGDYNNDGFLDLAASTFVYTSSPTAPNVVEFTQLFQNTGGTSLVAENINFSVPNLSFLKVGVLPEWVDFNNDGILDIYQQYFATYNETNTETVWQDRGLLYLNESTCEINTAPSPPSGLDVDINGSDVLLNWKDGFDPEQPSNSLSYKAFLYDAQNQISLQPHGHPDNGYRHLVQLGNQFQTRSWLVKDLPDGDYCFKVQAIDHAFEGSAWSEELCFTILNCQLTAEAIAIPPVICEGETANLRAISSGGTGTVQYQWNNGLGTGPAKTVTPTTTTVYQVTATDEAGCTATDTAEVVVNPLPIVVASPDTAICDGASVTLTATASGGSGGNYQFLWDNGLGAGPTHTVTPTVSTDYAVAVRDGNGCINTDTANVILNQRPTVVAAPDTTICEGETVTLIATAGGGSDGYTFTWDNGLGNGQSHDVSPDTSTTYSVTVTDAFGCADRDQATIIVNPLPSITAGPDTSVCAGSPIVLTAVATGGSNGNYSFVWDNGLGNGASHTITPTANITYTVVLTDGNGCTATDQVSITVFPNPEVTANPDTSICLGESVTLSAIATGGSGASYSYSWDNGLGIGQTHTVSPIQTTIYTVTATDENGCTATDQVTITVNPLPVVNLGPDTSICLGEELFLFAAATGGDGDYTFTWDNGLAPGQSQNVSPTVLTTYAVVLEDGNGCTDTDSITVLVNPLPGIEIVSVNCDPSLTTYRVEVQIESTHTLSAPSGEVIDNGGGSFSITSIPTGTDLLITITDPNLDCSSQETITAPDCSCPTDIPAPISGGDQSYCQGDDIPTLSVTVPDTLSVNWFDAASGGLLLFQSSTTYTPTAPGTYYAEAFVISNGCPSLTRTAVNLIELAPPPVAIIGDTIICAGETTTLTATGADTYLWSTDATSESIEVGEAGTYTVTGTDANGCSASATVQVIVSEPLEASFDNQNVLCNGDATGIANVGAFGGTPPYTYNWSNQVTGASNPGLTAGTYFVTITDSNDCTLETSTEITEPAAIVVTVTTDSVSCNGGTDGQASLDINGGTPGYNVIWPDQSTALSRTDLSAGSYEVSVSDINQCATTVSVLIGQPDPIFIEPLNVQDVSCAGASDGSISIQVGGGTAPYDIQWSNGSSGSLIENLAAGSYDVSISDANECLTSASFTVNQPQTLEISDAQIGSASCEGASDGSINLTISGGTPPYTFDWSNGSSTEDLIGVPAGTYSVEITDQNQCDVRGNFTIGNATTIFLGLSSTDATCGENNGFVDLSIDGGTTPFTFDWNNDGVGDNDDSEDLEELGAGEYFVSLTDANGCVAFSDTAIVNAIAPPVIEVISITPSICDAATGVIDIEVSGGTPPYNYNWSNQSNSQDLSQVPEGTYTIIVTDQNDCSISEEIVIGCTNPCSVAVGSMGTEKLMGCENEVLTASYNSEGEVVGEGEIRQFILHTFAGASLGETIFAILDEPTVFFIESQMQAGVEYYISAVVGKDNGNGQIDLSNDCLVVAPGTPFSFATAPTAPAELTATNTVLCSGQTLDLAVNVPLDGEISYLWETPRGAFVTDEPELQLENFTAEDIGDYFASYNINGCESDQLGPLFITLDESAAAVSGGEDILSCGDTEVTMAATLPAGTTGTWFTSSPARILEPDNPNTVVDSLISGDNIFIWIVNTGSCIVRDSVTVYHAVNPTTQDKDVLLQADKAALLLNKELLFDAITQTIPDSQLTFTIIKEPEFGELSDSLAGLYYLRDFDVQEDIETSFTYQVCNNDPQCGDLCSQANVNLTVKFLASEIISYKQALRPTGNNPVWNFTLLRNLSDAKITIVDRWGQLIYSQFFDSSQFDLLKGNTLVGWEGQNNKGLQLPSGAYYFLFEGTLADGTKPQPEKGIIYLLK